ncbi:MAG: tRNA (adenosine(37)-N6)-threonylcarbamoyltransferase complex ATPase subunit type 1 TsaE [Rhodospirillaceae bacterium]|nr:tRNA (adenosine(37)-N6)-threonylcarbamoyltransferase complex ATPase subunit type 1 TsaE [Rhodospirillaceae bacterium]|tara:strand:+ start:17189 stop:17686 length:498 start_codon:yes stop_codon:yes gene_type:complete
MADQHTLSHTVKLADLAATERFAAELAACLSTGDIVGLTGDLGMGKTVFARAVIRSLGTAEGLDIDDIPSPTFTLVQEYPFAKFSIFHIDLYRLDKPADALELGIEDIFSEGVSLIEWPERLEHYLPNDRLHLTLLPGDHESGRLVRIEQCGAWSDRDLTVVLDG